MLQTDPLRKILNAALEGYAQRRDFLVVIAVGDVLDLESVGHDAARPEYRGRIGVPGMLGRGVAGKFMAAARAFRRRQRQDLVALRADLGGRQRVIAALGLDANVIDWAKAADIAGEIQYAAIGFAVSLARAAADLLDIESG